MILLCVIKSILKGKVKRVKIHKCAEKYIKLEANSYLREETF